MTRGQTIVSSAVLVVLAGTAAWSQAAQREMQTGVKTADTGYVTSLPVEVSLADAEQAERSVLEGFQLLRDATAAAGFTPLGKARVVAQISMQAPPQGNVSFLLQLFVIEQPTDEDLKATHDFDLLPVEAEKVAYTFHKGPVRQAQLTFMRLAQWTMANNLDFGGYPYMILHDTSGKAPEVIEVQLPVK